MNELIQNVSLNHLGGMFVDINPLLVESLTDPNAFGHVVNEAASFIQVALNNGYVPSPDLLFALSKATTEEMKVFLDVLKESLGSHVKHVALFNNFPDLSDQSQLSMVIASWINLITDGEFTVDSDKQRKVLKDKVSYKELKLVTRADLNTLLTKTLMSKDSLPKDLRDFVEYAVTDEKFSDMINAVANDIVFKETLAIVVAHQIKNGIEPTAKLTPTDILRVVASLSGETDLSLNQTFKIKSLSRSKRRMIVNALAQNLNVNDIKKYKELWVRVFHSLHIGEYSKYPAIISVAKSLRSNVNIKTVTTEYNEAIKAGNMVDAAKILVGAPPVFARNLDKMLRDSQGSLKQAMILEMFESVADKINTKILLQLLGHIRNRQTDLEHRVVFTKGGEGRGILIDKKLTALSAATSSKLESILFDAITKQFAERNKFDGKKVFIGDSLNKILLPSQLASIGAKTNIVSRGSRVKIEGDGDYIRLFQHWKSHHDIDLSAIVLNEHFQNKGVISFYNTRGSYGVHSGDVRSAPDGGSEFVDIDINKALKHDMRYVLATVNVYSGPTFKNVDECFAGVMIRQKPNSGEIYDPRTVLTKVDLTTDCTTVQLCLIDIKTREMIWLDIPSGTQVRGYADKSFDQQKVMLEHFAKLTDYKVNLDELFRLHVYASKGAKLVKNKDEADIIIDYDGTISPYDVTLINSEYI